MTRRNTEDPLLKTFLATYKINLLSVPREKAEVGDTYVADPNGGVSAPGHLSELLTPELKMPEIQRDEKMAEIKGKQTRALELKLGVKLLDGFLAALGAGTAVGDVKAEYESKNASLVRFSLKNPVRDSVDPLALASALVGHRLNPKHPFVRDGSRYYVATAVVRSRSITVGAEDKKSNTIDVGAKALEGVVGASGKLAVKRETDGGLTYEGKIPLAFGVELLELEYDNEDKKIYLSAVPDPQAVRGIRVRAGADAAPGADARVFIGDPENGNVFVTVK